MKLTPLLFSFLLFTLLSQTLLAQKEQNDVRDVVQQFFQAMEKNDSVAFRSIFLPDAYNYYIQERGDSVKIGRQSSFGFTFNKNRIIKERFREKTVVIQLRRRIATVWGTYDLWINNQFSHCGTDVFTLLKVAEGWKIATLSFTMEKDGCK